VREALKVTVALQSGDIPAPSTQAIAIIKIADFGSNLLAGGKTAFARRKFQLKFQWKFQGNFNENSANGRHRVDKSTYK
jgi:hypothetical protein